MPDPELGGLQASDRLLGAGGGLSWSFPLLTFHTIIFLSTCISAVLFASDKVW